MDLSMFQNTSSKASNLRNQSLYVKFDPLVGRSVTVLLRASCAYAILYYLQQPDMWSARLLVV